MRLRACWHYWRENFQTAKEAYDMVELVLGMLFMLAGLILTWIFPHQSIFTSINNDTLGKILEVIACALFLWAILWLPFRRHEEYKKKHDKLMIHSAIYHKHNRFVDATPAISSRVQGNKVDVVVDNHLAGDPLKDTKKILTVAYSFGGASHKKDVMEGEKLRLPAKSD